MININKSYAQPIRNSYQFAHLVPGDIFTTVDPTNGNKRAPIFVKVKEYGSADDINAICIEDWNPIIIKSGTRVWKYEGNLNLSLDMHSFRCERPPRC